MGLIDKVVATAEKLRDVSQKIHDLELQGLVVDLKSGILDLKSELIQQREECIELRRKLEQQDFVAVMRKRLVREGSVYKLPEPFDGFGEGPYCMRCFDVEGILVNMSGMGAGRFICRNCTGNRKT